MSGAILPGAAIGVLGSGQLGRMFAIAARQMGYRVHVLSPDDDTPTGQVADVEVRADYLDLDAVARFAREVQVVTFEFENVPHATTETAERFAPVRPGGGVLYTTQNRAREKGYLHAAGIPVTPFRAVASAEEVAAAMAEFGGPCVLKTADWGYDGKGQAKVADVAEAAQAWSKLATSSAVLEKFIAFEREISVVVARGQAGDIAAYGPLATDHVNHILDVTVCPA
ncbi:MAG: ATP-grasp domain-containing protein, partial [Planctomycetales bacterium]|nr:ATP-grasp domain-containing protein [Planctomycetales bacterium]